MSTSKKTVVAITGANSGIGKATAARLAESGVTVAMICRNAEAGEAARREIIAESGNQAVELWICDLSSQSSIRELVPRFLERYERLDVLINNAANFDHSLTKPKLTADGVETIFATNHLGPFLMTSLLLPLLERSAPSRILTVASKGLLAYPFLSIEMENLDGSRRFSTQHAYYHSKLAQLMWSYDLAERLAGTGVTANCIRVPAVRVDPSRLAHMSSFARSVYQMKARAAITPEQMAKAYVRLALDPELGKATGKLFDESCREVRSSARSRDRAVWKRLWEVSAALTHLERK